MNNNILNKGDICEVVRGRKVKPGTVLTLFWVGQRETYQSHQMSVTYSYCPHMIHGRPGWWREYEEIAGATDTDGNKIWIKTKYLKKIGVAS